MTQQRQESGDESTNVQAGRDVTVYAGISVDEVREIALDVFRKNYIELSGIAVDVARGRAERITEDFLVELERRLPAGLQSATDPDMQRALFNAQSEFACSGEDDLERALVDLLVDRAAEDDRGTRALVLNEAITSAPKLTNAQRRAVALCFITKYTTWRGTLNIDSFYEMHVRGNILPLAAGLPTHPSDYQHIEYVGAGAIGIGQTELGATLISQLPGCFTRGFAHNQAAGVQDVIDDKRIVIPCIRDDSRFQLVATHDDRIDQVAEAAGLADRVAILHSLFKLGQLTNDEARDELVSRLPKSKGSSMCGIAQQ